MRFYNLPLRYKEACADFPQVHHFAVCETAIPERYPCGRSEIRQANLNTDVLTTFEII